MKKMMLAAAMAAVTVAPLGALEFKADNTEGPSRRGHRGRCSSPPRR